MLHLYGLCKEILCGIYLVHKLVPSITCDNGWVALPNDYCIALECELESIS